MQQLDRESFVDSLIQQRPPDLFFTCKINLVPKKAPIFARGRAQKHPETASFERWLGLLVRSQYKGKPLDEPLVAHFRFFIKHDINYGQIQYSRPDASNLVKSAEDALNGIVWSDDGRLQTVIIDKFYSRTEGVEIRVWKVIK